MNYCIYKLNFTSPIHLGNGKLSDHEYHLFADTLFSAMCIEARQMYGNETLENLINLVNENKLRISDGFPFYSEENDVFFIPKPMISIKSNIDDYDTIKKYKKLKYIELDKIEEFMQGNLDLSIYDIQNNIGTASFRNLVNVHDEYEDSEPYKVGTFSFNEGYGLYIICGYENEEIKYLVEDILVSLEYSGIGGKRNMGLGRFQLDYANIPEHIEEMLTIDAKMSEKKKMISLSIALPNDEELDSVMENATYVLIKRSGFTDGTFSNGNLIRKNDFYAMASGSVFNRGFSGILKNIVEDYYHPVFKYAKSMFLEV